MAPESGGAPRPESALPLSANACKHIERMARKVDEASFLFTDDVKRLAKFAAALLAETERLRAALDRLSRYPEEERQRQLATAEQEALKYAPTVVDLCSRWQGYDGGPPETFDYQEAVAAIVAQLNREGVTAWNGDATWCIAHMLKAQYDRWAKLRVETERLRVALQKAELHAQLSNAVGNCSRCELINSIAREALRPGSGDTP